MYQYKVTLLKYGYPRDGYIELRWEIRNEDNTVTQFTRAVSLMDLKHHESIFDYIFEDSRTKIIDELKKLMSVRRPEGQ